MAENLKRFFKKKKVDLTFKKAGPGVRLNEETKKPAIVQNQPCVTRAEQSAEARQAAAAALARLQINIAPSSGFSKSSAYKQVKEEVRQELKSRSQSRERGSSSAQSSISDAESSQKLYASNLAATGVYFTCPLVGPEILSKDEWKTKIREYLYSQIEEEKGLIACLIIRNCNKNAEKINVCIETLCKYLQNVISNPNEEKYRKIRISNKAFQERVANIEGSFEFLEAAGFVRENVLVGEENEEFFVLPSDVKDTDSLEMLCDALTNAEVINLELDRNIQILLPSQAESRTELPADFFRFTPDELKKEQQNKTESVDCMMMLRTKAMREKQEQKEMKKYKYALIRIRFPDGILLQGTFSVHEKYEEVYNFAKENLAFNCDFSLVTAELGKAPTEEEFSKTLLELRLVPATILLFHTTSSSDSKVLSYLKPDVKILLQDL